MSFDINGNKLRPGYCEVHPWVEQDYPCSLCMREGMKDYSEKQARNIAQEAEQNEYYAEMRRNTAAELDSDYKDRLEAYNAMKKMIDIYVSTAAIVIVQLNEEADKIILDPDNNRAPGTGSAAGLTSSPSGSEP